MNEKNKCPSCGGQLVVEYIGSYGSVYKLLRNGKVSKRRFKRFLYEESEDGAMIYCWNCRKLIEEIVENG